MVLRKTSFRSCFKLGTHSTMLWLYDHIMQIFDHLSVYATKTRTKIAYDKAKRKLKQATHKFSNEQNHKEKLQQNNFSIYFTFFANRNK